MNDQQIADKVKQEAWAVVDGLINGGGDQLGLGESLTASMSMTAATETYWGTSGKGNPNAAKRIRIVAGLGYVRIERRGRTERIGLTESGIELYYELAYLGEPVPAYQVCAACSGTGSSDREGRFVCQSCKGTGQV